METEWIDQEKDLIVALDIGTRSVIGVAGRAENGRFRVLAIERAEHSRRAMIDGQIEDIAQVALVVAQVREKLEERLSRRLRRVCIAAAGRALRTEKGHYELTLPQVRVVNDEMLSRLEAGAVSAAESALDSNSRLFLVGYTVSQYLLDNYPFLKLNGHGGQKLEADVVATFLPAGVIESLYAVVNRCGLEVASLTLEPIAAMNVAIPADLRLLNLAMIDVGAGTSDIALCRNGSVVGYTMATVAGDEITEAIMREFLVDFATAEQIKKNLTGTVTFTDILGMEQTVDAGTVCAAIQTTLSAIAKELAEKICAVNGGVPSAVFLAGGGSKMTGLGEEVAQALGIEPRRVAIAGSYFKNTVFSEEENLLDPIYATPLGIASSAGLGLISDSYRLLLNGRQAHLFRGSSISAMDVLMMNGFTYGDLIGRSGKPLTVFVDGKRKTFYGGTAVPSALRINGAEAIPSATVQSGDAIEFIPAVSGADAAMTAEQLQTRLHLQWPFEINGKAASHEQRLRSGDRIVTGVFQESGALLPEENTDTAEKEARRAPEPLVPEAPHEEISGKSKASGQRENHFFINEVPLSLPAKENGDPYYLMDVLKYSGIDFDHLEAPVLLKINGADGQFLQPLMENDHVIVRLESKFDD